MVEPCTHYKKVGDNKAKEKMPKSISSLIQKYFSLHIPDTVTRNDRKTSLPISGHQLQKGRAMQHTALQFALTKRSEDSVSSCIEN